MENFRFIKKIEKIALGFFLGAFLIFPITSDAYEISIHRKLTSETLKSYEKLFGKKFNSKKINKAVYGSAEEDDGFRPLRHFYDPINNRGLTVVKSWEKSKKWAKDTKAQSSLLAPLNFEEKYFENSNDFSWNRAIYEYVYGDKDRAFETLGHILHLIQDTTVPAHVRNDAHLNKFGYGDINLYEKFTKNLEIPKYFFALKDIPHFLNLDEAFDKSAKFTNINFLSKDTIFKDYENPNKLNLLVIFIHGRKFLISRISDKQVKIATIKPKDSSVKWRKYLENSKIKIYTISDPQNLILSDYWKILSKQAVLNGVGIIDLFFRDVSREKKTHILRDKNKSWADKAKQKIAETKKTIIDDFYSVTGIINEKKTASSNQNLASVVNSLQKTVKTPLSSAVKTPQSNSKKIKVNKQKTKTKIQNKIYQPIKNKPTNQQKQNIPVTKKLLKKTPNSPNIIKPVLALVSYSPGFGGGGSGISKAKKKEAKTKTIQVASIKKVNSPVIIKPINKQNFNKTTITFIGKASTTDIIYTDFSQATTSSNKNEDWSLVLKDFKQGSTTIAFFSSNKNQTATSTKVKREVFIDSKAPKIKLNIKECHNSLSNTGCLLTTKTTLINANWSSDENDLDYFILNKNGNISTTTATSTQISIKENLSYSLSVSAVDKMGNISNPVTQIIEINNLPVVINEVAWAGTSAKTSRDEWIELYNNTNYDINLENWTLYAEDNTPYIPLSKTIPAKGYFLLERTDDTTVNDIPADLIYKKALSNQGEHLILTFNKNGATTTVDEIPQNRNYWGGKGSVYRYASMERYDSTQPSGENLENWKTNLYSYILNGENANGGKILGTPKARNSVSYLISNQNSLSLDKTLTKENSPYFINESIFDIKKGVTLTIEKGVVIKFAPTHGSSLRVHGVIKTKGTTEEPVIFTSFYDDVGGDTNNDGACEPKNASSTSACPSAGDWGQILLEAGDKGSSLEHTIVKYGGYPVREARKYVGMLTVKDTGVLIKNSVFEKSMSRGVQLLNVASSTEISNNIFRKNDYRKKSYFPQAIGLDILGGSLLVENNLFENNNYGLHLAGSSSAVNSNIFNNNIKEAITSYGLSSFSHNSGTDNGINGIIIGFDITSASSTNTLKKNSLPYFIESYPLVVVASSTLKINPGVTIKFGNTSLVVKGNLEVNGSDKDKVLFTAVEDDSDGVNVRNDSQPEEIIVGKKGIYLKPNSTSIIKNAEIRYMKYGVHYEHSLVNLENVVFKNNELGVFLDADSVIQTAQNIIFSNNKSTSTRPLY